MDISGSTDRRIQTMADSQAMPENSTDDDTASVSSLTSYESNLSSVCSIPGMYLVLYILIKSQNGDR